MSGYNDSDGDAPPAMDPVRRDPDLGFQRDPGKPRRGAFDRRPQLHTPYRPDEPSAGRGDWITKRVLGFATIIIAICGAFVLLGTAAHAIWRAIILGWGIG